MSLYHRFGKRTIDVVLSIVALTCLSPLLLILMLLVRLTSKGPALFVQDRIGKDGKHFSFIKFRTMYLEVDSSARERAEALAKKGVLLKIENDPRVTPVGRFLRLTSLDELPQLINILRGEMSLVGPRPLIPFMMAHHPEESSLRNNVLPGLTGYWQVYARSESSSLMQMLEYDLRYIRELSLQTDIKLLALTIPAIVTGRGAK